MLTVASSPDWKKTSRRVLLLLSPLVEEGSHKIAKGVARYLAQHENWEIYFDPLPLAAGDTRVERAHWDGVISAHTPASLIEACGRLGLPLVDINPAQPHPGVASVSLDQVAVGRAGAEHLVDRGAIHFAFSGFTNQPCSRARRKGFLQTLQLRGRHCRLVESVYPDADTPEWHRQEIETLRRWLRDTPRPLGIMACNDARAAQLIHAAEAEGLSVPEDVAILGANDNETRCELAKPPISSVAINEVEWGYKAAETLHRLMDGLPGEALVSVAPLGVVTRNSTDMVAINDKRVAAAVRFIQEHGCEAITVADVCRHAGIARTQLEQKFRTYFARSPQAEVRRVRLTRIRQLLHETDLPLKTIAELTGFPHVEYMSVFCKKAFGESPGRYRRRIRGSESPAAENMLPPSLA